MTKFLNISTDNTLGGSSASDETVSSQKAIKDYIDGKALVNNATGTNSFSINSSTGNNLYAITNKTTLSYSDITLFGYNADGNYNYSTCFGSGATAVGGSATCIGWSAKADYDSVSIGSAAGGSTPKKYATCIGGGAYTQADYCVAIGALSRGGSSSTSTYSTAIGTQALASAAKSIQLGYGTNTEASTMYVGSQGGTNYKLLDLTTGNIPIARLGATSSDTSKFLKGDGTWAAALTTSDIVSSVSSSSTNTQAVGAKLFYDTCGDIETLINAL